VVKKPAAKPVYSKSVVVKKAAPKPAAPKPVVKPQPKPAEDEAVTFTKSGDEYIVRYGVAPDEPAVDEPDVDVEEDEEEDVAEEESTAEEESAEEVTEKSETALDLARQAYTDKVMKDDAYVSLLGSLKFGFYGDEDNSSLERLESMNNAWNAFRNAAYDEYYKDDYSLKSGIDYEEYAEDEYILRLYTNAYFEFYEHISNEFVMTYEYANGAAKEMYGKMESELQSLGRPDAKLDIMVEMFNAVQEAGGATSVIDAIAVKNVETADISTATEEDLVLLGSVSEVAVTDVATGAEEKYEVVETAEYDILNGTESDEYTVSEVAPGNGDLSDDEVAAGADSDEEDDSETADSGEEADDAEDSESADADSPDEKEEAAADEGDEVAASGETAEDDDEADDEASETAAADDSSDYVVENVEIKETVEVVPPQSGDTASADTE
jgi:hypothetical protein